MSNQHLTVVCLHKMSQEFARIPTKATLLKSCAEDGEKEPEYKVVIHKKRQKKVPSKPKIEKITNQPSDEDQQASFKRARHDIIRLGATGLGEKEKKKAQIALAVKLGAKPPKGTPKSLKEFHEERRAAELKKTEETHQLLPKSINNFHCNQLISIAKRRKQRRAEEGNTITAYGKVDKKSLGGKTKRK